MKTFKISVTSCTLVYTKSESVKKRFGILRTIQSAKHYEKHDKESDIPYENM